MDRAEVVPARRGGSPGDGRRRRSGDREPRSEAAEAEGLTKVVFRGDVRQLADRMHLGGYLRPVNLLSLESGPLKPPPKEEARFPGEREKELFRHFDWERDYVPPGYAFDALGKAIKAYPVGDTSISPHPR